MDLDQLTRLQDKLHRLKQMDVDLSFFGANDRLLFKWEQFGSRGGISKERHDRIE
jgi:hypothetical protein